MITQQYEFEVDFTKPAEIDLSNDWRNYARMNCSKPFYEINPLSGKYEISFFHPCRQYSECPICGAKKKEQEIKRLTKIQRENPDAKYIEVDEDEAKKLVRKYGKDNVRRVALEDGKAAVIVDTSDEIENSRELDRDVIKKILDNIITGNDGRRPSGNLGKSAVVVKKEEPPKEDNAFDFEIDWDAEPEIDDETKVTTRKMEIEFDSDNPIAPKSADEVQAIVFEEVEIDSNPYSREELREGIKKIEDKWEEVCKRYGMSFRFYSKNLKVVNLYHVKWEFVKKRE